MCASRRNCHGFFNPDVAYAGRYADGEIDPELAMARTGNKNINAEAVLKKWLVVCLLIHI